MKKLKRKHLVRVFVPHHSNKFHPLVLRPIGLAMFLVLYVSIPLLYNMAVVGQFKVLGYATNVSVSALHQLTNQERANNGAGQLRLNAQLNNAAKAKADHMIANDYWAHVSPDGVSPWTFVASAGYDYQTAGENLAKGFSTSSGIISGWMNSSSHRANMLNSKYSDVGFAAVNGVLQGSETTLVVAFYAEPYNAPAPAQAPQTAQPSPAPDPAPSPPNQEQPTVEAEPIEEPEPEETIVESPEPPEENTAFEEAEVPVTATTRNDGGNVAGLANFALAEQYVSMNWGQRASIVLLSAMMLLYIMKHTLVWREQKRGYRHIWLRSHPLAQASLLLTVFIVTILSSIGVVL